MKMPPERHFKHIKKFWFQDEKGIRRTAKECCSDKDGNPCLVVFDRSMTFINSGVPVVNESFKCGICGKILDLE